MDLERLKELIEFMNANDLSELEIEEEGNRVKLKKSSGEQPVILSKSAGSASGPENLSPEKSVSEGTIEIKSPMVGTFYRAPAPGANSFTEIGSEIHPGDVVCIIEAMKLMNEIKAEIGGKVVDILVENGEPIEFGQPLFLVKPL